MLPDGTVSVEFDVEYLRELTIPKTKVDVKVHSRLGGREEKK